MDTGTAVSPNKSGEEERELWPGCTAEKKEAASTAIPASDTMFSTITRLPYIGSQK